MDELQEIVYKCKQALKQGKPIDAYLLYRKAKILKKMKYQN